MFAAATKTNKVTPAVQAKTAGNTFFRKAGEERFFGVHENASFFNKPVQAKLTVSSPDDPHEKEADAVADKVMRMPEPVTVLRQPEKKEELHRKDEEKVEAKQQTPVAVKIQCKANPKQQVQAKLNAVIQRSARKQITARLDTASVNDSDHSTGGKNISLYGSDILRQSGRGPPQTSIPFEQTLSSSKGGGSPLPGSTQTFMESRFNADFGNVRIHTNDTAQNLTSQVNAQAFAHGNDIYFNSGKFSPNSTEGGTLLAHELTHTIQQGASKTVDRTPIKNKISPKNINKKTGSDQPVIWKTATDKGIKVGEQNPAADHSIAKKEEDVRRKNDTAKTNKKTSPDTPPAPPLQVQPKPVVAAKSKSVSVQPDVIALTTEKKELQKKEPELENKENTSGSHEFLVSKKSSSRSVIPELHKCPHCSSISRKPAGGGSDLSTMYAGSHTCSACSTVLQASERGPPLRGGGITTGHVQPDTVLQRDDEAPPEKSWLDKLKETFESTLAELLPASVYNFYSKIKNGGLLNYIKDILAGLFKGLFGKLGFSEDQIQLIFDIFARLKSQLPAIIDGLAKGDCKPLFAALDLLSEVVGAIAGKVWDNLMAELEPVRLWLIDIWDTFGAPVVEEIKFFLGEEWEMLKTLGKFIWDSFKPIRDAGADAWDWVVKKLGFGTSDEPGLLSYVSDKLSEAWQNIKTELKPIIEPINEVVEGIKTLASLTDIQKLKEDAKKWLDDVVKTATAMGGDEDAVASKQLTLRQVLLPALNKSIDRLKGTLQSAADWLTDKISFIAGKVTSFITGLQGNQYLAPMYPLIKWLPGAVDKLKDWATDKVTDIFTKIQTSVDHLKQFVEPLLTLLEKLVGVASNLLKNLPDLILGVPFMFMPRCIKDPIIKWLTDVVLRQIPIIGDFIALADKWDEIKSAALLVLKQVFVDGQLAKGLWTFFKTLLGILGIDPKLVTKVIAKAAQNFSDIISKPGQFFKNVWGVIKGGFARFFDNIWTHLPQGALDWLFGEAGGGESVALPKKPFSISGVLGFVLKLFGISLDNVYKRMSEHKQIGPERVAKIKAIENALTDALEWITVWIRDGPEGLLKKAKQKMGDIKDMVIQGVVSWVTTKITAQITKKLATSVDPLGIGATINTIITIYESIRAAVVYMNKILNLVDNAMDNMADIIAGRTDAAAEKFEKILARAVPVVIGFAVEALLGSIGVKIKEIVDKVHKKIDDAIDWLINGALNVIDKIIATGKKGVKAIAGWLGIEESYTNDAGEGHKLSAELLGNNLTVKRASNTPEHISIFLTNKTTEINNPSSTLSDQQKTEMRSAIAEAQTIITKIQAISYPEGAPEKSTIHLKQQANTLLAGLKSKIQIIDKGSVPVPPVTIVPGFSSNLASSLNVKYLLKGHHPPGTPAESFSGDLHGGMSILESLGLFPSKWVRFHILNHNTGGIAIDSNLIPTTKGVNNAFKDSFETLFKAKYDDPAGPKVMWFNGNVTYISGTVFAQSVSAEGGAMKPAGKDWVPDPANRISNWSSDVPAPIAESIQINNLPRTRKLVEDMAKYTPLTKDLLVLLTQIKPPVVKGKSTLLSVLANYVNNTGLDASKHNNYINQIEATTFNFN